MSYCKATDAWCSVGLQYPSVGVVPKYVNPSKVKANSPCRSHSLSDDVIWVNSYVVEVIKGLASDIDCPPIYDMDPVLPGMWDKLSVKGSMR